MRESRIRAPFVSKPHRSTGEPMKIEFSEKWSPGIPTSREKFSNQLQMADAVGVAVYLNTFPRVLLNTGCCPLRDRSFSEIRFSGLILNLEKNDNY